MVESRTPLVSLKERLTPPFEQRGTLIAVTVNTMAYNKTMVVLFITFLYKIIKILFKIISLILKHFNKL